MKKKAVQKIREITDVLGDVVTRTTEWVPISGRDLLLSGHGKDPRVAQTLIPDKEYEIAIPVDTHHSGKKALKRAFRSKGEKGLEEIVRKEYIKRI